MSEAKIVTITNQKGGVGKSTSSFNFAIHLAEQDKRVCFIDFDGQGNSSGLFLDDYEQDDISSFRSVDLFDLESEKELEVTETIWGVDVIRADKNDMELYEYYSAPLEDSYNPRINIEPILSEYDYIIIDSPPSLGTTLIAALAMSTDVICIVELSGFAMDGMEGLFNTINLVQEGINENLNFAGILVNKFNSRSPSHKHELVHLKDELGDMVLGARIALRSSIDTANLERVPVWKMAKKSGASRVAAQEMKAAFNEIIKRINN